MFQFSRTTSFLLLPLLVVSTLSSAYVCFPAPSFLPSERDCRALVHGLFWLSEREPRTKTWSRHLDTTQDTEQLPKWFYVEGRQPPTTCLVVVDSADFYAVERFPMRGVASSANTVLQTCVEGRGQIGIEFPGEDGPVYVKMERLGGPPPNLFLANGQRRKARRVMLPDGNSLYISDGPRANSSRANNLDKTF